jgi:hypothetical protein
MLGLPQSFLDLLADTEQEAQIRVVHWGLKPENLIKLLRGSEEAPEPDPAEEEARRLGMLYAPVSLLLFSPVTQMRFCL